MMIKEFTEREAEIIGIKLGINWDNFNVEQFRNGINIELEHGSRYPKTNISNDDMLITAKIALAHLNEYADYYTRLGKMEKEAEEFWREKK
jgi:hypothetical protein